MRGFCACGWEAGIRTPITWFRATRSDLGGVGWTRDLSALLRESAIIVRRRGAESGRFVRRVSRFFREVERPFDQPGDYVLTLPNSTASATRSHSSARTAGKKTSSSAKRASKEKGTPAGQSQTPQMLVVMRINHRPRGRLYPLEPLRSQVPELASSSASLTARSRRSCSSCW